ncbi:hypothetical protein ACKVMT_13615 [Halobacteriales archaeon Cl-PHB]
MTADWTTFWEMARAFPVRTALLTVAPVVLAFAQLCNALVFGGPVLVSGLFAALLVAVVAQLTRWQLATFHRRRLLGEHR